MRAGNRTVTEDTSCRFAVNPAAEEQEAPSGPLCSAYHIGQMSKGPARTSRGPGTDARIAVAEPPIPGECIRTESKDEDPS